MLHITKGIVLKTTKFSETSVVAHIYTEKFGRLSYMINGVRQSKSKFSPALLQAFTPLEMVTYYQENKNLQRLTEIRPLFHLHHIPFEVARSTLALFLAEIVYRTVKEQEYNPALFLFMEQTIVRLDNPADSVANLHLAFLAQLTAFLGFFPQNNFFHTERAIFDLNEGVFTHRLPQHAHYIALPLSERLSKLLQTSIDTCHTLALDRNQRRELLHGFLQYYQLHIEGMSPIQSLKVMEEVWQ